MVPTWAELQTTSYANWKKLPDLVRQDCINELKDKLPPWLVDRLKSDTKKGSHLGCHDPMFHFGNGMAIRNVLRNQLTDGELPPIIQPDGLSASNWDDYYIGALQEFIEQVLAQNPK